MRLQLPGAAGESFRALAARKKAGGRVSLLDRLTGRSKRAAARAAVEAESLQAQVQGFLNEALAATEEWPLQLRVALFQSFPSFADIPDAAARRKLFDEVLAHAREARDLYYISTTGAGPGGVRAMGERTVTGRLVDGKLQIDGPLTYADEIEALAASWIRDRAPAKRMRRDLDEARPDVNDDIELNTSLPPGRKPDLLTPQQQVYESRARDVQRALGA